jgi:two-component system cell cycle sensor histidine kinase/response regulator CckA
MADSVQVEQVLMNLVTNARDAMPGGGTLTISSSIEELNEDVIAVHGYGIPGTYVKLSIADTGAGMDEKTRERIFEPFFTTKEMGKGTGLGLASTYGLVKQHKGFIDVDSEPGRGTSFHIYFPTLNRDASTKETPAEPALKGGTESILVAEDDEVIRNLTSSILREFGYTVIVAMDGNEAVRAFKENRDRIGLLLFDVIMPRKNGKDAFEEIRTIRPDIKVLFISGYSADMISTEGILEEGLSFISKPVSPSELLKKVREILDRTD